MNTNVFYYLPLFFVLLSCDKADSYNLLVHTLSNVKLQQGEGRIRKDSRAKGDLLIIDGCLKLLAEPEPTKYGERALYSLIIPLTYVLEISNNELHLIDKEDKKTKGIINGKIIAGGGPLSQDWWFKYIPECAPPFWDVSTINQDKFSL